ncbi:MAG: UDP-N-acetylglucosamine diphosphorylase [Simkaniaceae bacterium]|nr:UDP-N-acetylglucosamine diphosphorylase [Simkaniaceae bacterium]
MNNSEFINTSTTPKEEEKHINISLISYTSFFDLNSFEHIELFHNDPVWSALKTLKEYVDKLDFSIEVETESAYLVNREKISIGKGSVIEPGAYIEGPCVIGKNCVVRHGAYVRPYTLTGDGCTIGHSSEVKHSILLNGCALPHFNYVGDSIIGSNVNLGAGLICANLRLDKGEVFVHVSGQKIPTGLSKMGAIVGDGSSLGCNCVTNPGALFKKGSLASPCRSLPGKIK